MKIATPASADGVDRQLAMCIRGEPNETALIVLSAAADASPLRTVSTVYHHTP